MTGGTAGARQHRGPFGVDEDAVLAEMQEAWSPVGYGAFGVADGTWSAVSSRGDVLTGNTPDELARKVRAHWQEMQ